MKKNCVVLELESVYDFQYQLNKYLLDGYKIESSSCNGKYYRAILVYEEKEKAEEVDADFIKKIEDDTKTALLDAIENNLSDIGDNLMKDYHNADAVIRATVNGVFLACYGGVDKFREEKL